MPSVMIREQDGEMTLYVPKKDLEEKVESLEFDSEDKWGGEVVLGDGSKFYLEPMDEKPKLPITLRAKRL
ncbi:putative nitrogen fixation protein NifT [Endothiovibrio diazotrophicus]